MSTIKEVSKLAGVSVSTVSRVVNGTKYVSPDIEKRVREAIDELGYQPSAFARGLRLRESKSVGVLVPALNDAFFGNLAFAVEKTVFSNGYHPLFCSTENDVEKQSAYIDVLLRQHVDAVIMVPTIPPADSMHGIQKFLDQGISVVIVERSVPDLNASQVLVDNFQGGYIGARHLLELGHQKLGVVASPPSKRTVKSMTPVSASKAFTRQSRKQD